ncbi:hypothetical protein PCE1_003154 [Barthelona sp. PCE]
MGSKSSKVGHRDNDENAEIEEEYEQISQTTVLETPVKATTTADVFGFRSPEDNRTPMAKAAQFDFDDGKQVPQTQTPSASIK